MNLSARPELLAAAAALIPALGAWLAYPRRPWGALAALFAGLAAGGALVAAAPAEARAGATLVAAWAALGSAALWAVLRRGEAAAARAGENLALVRARRAQTAKELASLKARGLDAERAHKETMALCGMVKGLSGRCPGTRRVPAWRRPSSSVSAPTPSSRCTSRACAARATCTR